MPGAHTLYATRTAVRRGPRVLAILSRPFQCQAKRGALMAVYKTKRGARYYEIAVFLSFSLSVFRTPEGLFSRAALENFESLPRRVLRMYTYTCTCARADGFSRPSEFCLRAIAKSLPSLSLSFSFGLFSCRSRAQICLRTNISNAACPSICECVCVVGGDIIAMVKQFFFLPPLVRCVSRPECYAVRLV